MPREYGKMKKVLLIDIDNTIYPKSTGLQTELMKRAKEFIKNEIQPNAAQNDNFAKRLVNKHGSIMHGLIVEYKIDAEEFIKYSFNIDVGDYLKPNPSLHRVLNRIALIKIAFSNSPEDYVEKVLDTVGVLDCFSGIYGSRFMNYSTKLDPAVYEKLIRELNTSPSNCILIDDRRDYILKAKELGLSTIWVNEESSFDIEGDDLVITNILEIENVRLFKDR